MPGPVAARDAVAVLGTHLAVSVDEHRTEGLVARRQRLGRELDTPAKMYQFPILDHGTILARPGRENRSLAAREDGYRADVDSPPATPVSRLLDAHRPADDVERADVDRIRRWLSDAADAADPWDRTAPLHLTASAFVVHPSTGRVLLRRHPRQRAWLHVGGHGDPGETDPVAVALREAREETGLTDLRPHSPALLHALVVPVATSGTTVVEHADLRYLLVTEHPDEVRPERPDAPLRWATLSEARELTTEDNVRRSLRRVEAVLRGER